MALEDNEMLDRAMDAAEAKLMIDDEPEAAPARSEADPELEDALTSEALKAEKPVKQARGERDNSGKFRKAAKTEEPAAEEASEEQVSDQTAEVETGAEVAQGEEPQGEAPTEMPAFWSAEMKAAIAKAPREAQEAFIQYDAQRSQWANRMQVEADRGKAVEKGMWADFESQEAIEAHKSQLALAGMKHPVEELHRYRAWDRVFKSDVRQGIAALLQKNGLTPYDLLNEDQGEPQYQTDPRVEEAIRAANEAKKAAEEFKTYTDNQKIQAGQSQLESFRQGKDTSGQVRSTYFDLYRPQITQAFQTILGQNPNIPEADALNHAYEFVVKEAKKVFGINGSVKPAAPAVADVKKAKIAASSVTGAPKSGTVTPRSKLKGSSFNERLESALDNAEEQLSSR